MSYFYDHQFYDSDYPVAMEKRRIFLLGFSGKLDMFIEGCDFSEQSGIIWDTAHHPLRAQKNLEYLASSGDVFELPGAIIINWHWAQDCGSGLLDWISRHAELRNIPLIGLADVGTVVDPRAVVALGLDDCYRYPVSWALLEERIAFLHQYKAAVKLKSLELTEEAFALDIPLGKRVLDIIGACIAIVVTMPLWSLTMIAIAMETRGPVIYKSKRVGAGYHTFDFFKFRSMYRGAEGQLDSVQHLNQYGEAAPFVKICHDPRITKVGRFIRKYSIDELPQLYNILLGDMSLVGNRPLPTYEAEALTNDQFCGRFLAPAGLTGLWQVTKRGSSDMDVEDRVALDIAYGNRLSLRTDMAIIMKTFTAFVQKEDV
jgi:lipopolysaccharide/colanic/teichoic acid biosynthesis glycosyltransferase